MAGSGHDGDGKPLFSMVGWRSSMQLKSAGDARPSLVFLSSHEEDEIQETRLVKSLFLSLQTW